MTLRYTLLLALTSGALVSLAQPTLTTATSVPAAGTTIPVITAPNYVGAGPAGADVTYDYWNILSPSTGTRNIYYLDPSVTATSASIPSATLLSTDGGSDTLFWDVTAQGLEQVGVRASLEGTVAFSDPGLELAFPCTYGTMWSDPTGASYVITGVGNVTRVGTITGNADAYGTLTMPWGVTYPEVLRVHVRRDLTDNSLLANVTRIANVRYYYIATMAHPVVKLTEDSVRIGTGAWTVAKAAQWMGNPVGVGMSEVDASDFSFNAYPNPAVDQLNVAFEQGASVATRMEVLDVAGRIVLNEAVVGGRGTLTVSQLPAGVYTVRVLAGAQVLGTQRIAVQ